MICNRRGEETVEAALVLPLLILTILSLIMLMLYYFDCLTDQVHVHGDLLGKAAVSEDFFRRIRMEQSTSFETDGLVSLLMKKETTHAVYVLEYGKILRAGELVALD